MCNLFEKLVILYLPLIFSVVYCGVHPPATTTTPATVELVTGSPANETSTVPADPSSITGPPGTASVSPPPGAAESATGTPPTGSRVPGVTTAPCNGTDAECPSTIPSVDNETSTTPASEMEQEVIALDLHNDKRALHQNATLMVSDAEMNELAMACAEWYIKMRLRNYSCPYLDLSYNGTIERNNSDHTGVFLVETARGAIGPNASKKATTVKPPASTTVDHCALGIPGANGTLDDCDDDSNSTWEDLYPYDRYGENLYWTNFIQNPINATVNAIEMWYNESSKWNYENGTCKGGTIWGCLHFTQIVWKNSTKLGFGYSKDPTWGNIVVAIYSKPGNYPPAMKEQVPLPWVHDG